MKKIDFVGQKFGRLLVVAEAATRSGPKRRFYVVCDCGVRKDVQGTALRTGNTRSCGCLQRETRAVAKVTHGASRDSKRTREYRTWVGMKSRCTNPTVERYHRYGGRGIRVCDRWMNSFEAFLADVGQCPSPLHQIDRYPNNDGNYEPGNVRWATPKQQAWSNSGENHYTQRKAAKEVDQ